MILSVDIILDRYAAILSGEVSYAQADAWAWQLIESLDSEEIDYQPPTDEVLIWELITYLVGLNFPGVSGKEYPLTTDIGLLHFLKEKGLPISRLT